MTTQFSVADIELSLSRYPANQVSNLQAWDAADEHLIKHLKEIEQKVDNTAVINDSFGALCAALTAQATDWPIWVETDAKTSQLGTLLNFEANQLSHDNLTWLNSRELPPQGINLVLMKLPKNLNYFIHQLQRLSQSLAPNTPVYIGAKAKAINKALLETIAKHLGPASASLAWKKTRVITCIADGKPRAQPSEVSWPVKEFNLTISNLSNVFAANKLDIGARIMLDNLPAGQFDTIVDLGCGNGILGLRAKQCYPGAEVHFVDESEMAITSARQNWLANKLDNPEQAMPQGHFHWDDCLTHLGDEIKPDLVLCNPPFHQGEAITDHIAWQMFLDAFHKLRPGGMLQVVGNRHLGYHIKLKRIFKNCETAASNGKFVILRAIKSPKGPMKSPQAVVKPGDSTQ
ncbi:methyltransferase [Shewanella sp. JBTF-M18]|uniref:Ribosomal RNA large subunit methyltransferase G n=1 Tax=Shewanella insulae TaxID=2681496 RepID=A0A6L7I0V0_9GAMM|nr:methyltransferase [Shewanella insulae]MXR70175.1 methyltransferase [Shewanella insulae]